MNICTFYSPAIFRKTITLYSMCTIFSMPNIVLAQKVMLQERILISGPLTLENAVKTGLRENLMIKAAKADVRAANAETRAAQSMIRPQISANTFLTQGDTSNILSSSPGVLPTNLYAVPSRSFVDQNITLMFPISTGGRLNGLVRAASEREHASIADTDRVQNETVLQIKETYFRAQLLSEIVKAALARVEADEVLLKNTSAMVDVGKSIEASLLRVQAELADAQRILTTARNDQSKMMLYLKTAMGVNLESVISLSDSLVFAPPAGSLAFYLNEAIKNRPELKAARSRAASADAQIGAARATFQPQIYGTAMLDAFASSGRSSGTYTFGLTMSLPLIDGGQRRAETDRARAGKDRVAAEVLAAEQQISTEVRQSWLDVETAAQNYKTAQSALQAAQSAYEVTALRVLNQKAILLEQLDSLAALTQARTNVGVSLYDHSVAIARLLKSSGKGRN